MNKQLKQLDITTVQDTGNHMDRDPYDVPYCVFCARDIGKPKFQVNLTCDGFLLNTPDENTIPGGSSLWYTDRKCKKRVPNEFVFLIRPKTNRLLKFTAHRARRNKG